ncbi:MAG TPA: MFS transporter [Caulobacteraceae bacterium]|jgi:AAHS family 3-hydroxyphenylpropionic acid transporter
MSALSEAAATSSIAPVGAWRVRLTLALCFAAALTEGYDITSMGVAAPHLGPALHLARAQLGPVFSASIVGLFIGALAVGRLADRVGRKWTLVGSMAVFGVFSAATVLATGFDDLIAIRLAAGLGLGGAMPNMIALASEVSSERRRTMVTTIVSAGMPFGGMLSSAVAAGLDWRWIFYLGGAAPLLLGGVMALALDESPHFKAVRSMAASGASRRSGFLWALTGEGRTLSTLCLWVSTFCALMALYTLLNWLPILLGEKGVSKHDASIVALLFNLGGGLAVIALAVLIERARRRVVVVAWYASLIVSLILLALVGPELVAASFIAFFAGGFSSSVAILLYGLAPNYYPTAIRATGVGATVAVGRLGAVVGPLFAAWLLSSGVAQDGVLLALAPMAVLAGAACVALLGRPTAI